MRFDAIYRCAVFFLVLFMIEIGTQMVLVKVNGAHLQGCGCTSQPLWLCKQFKHDCCAVLYTLYFCTHIVGVTCDITRRPVLYSSTTWALFAPCALKKKKKRSLRWHECRATADFLRSSTLLDRLELIISNRCWDNFSRDKTMVDRICVLHLLVVCEFLALAPALVT